MRLSYFVLIFFLMIGIVGSNSSIIYNDSFNVNRTQDKVILNKWLEEIDEGIRDNLEKYSYKYDSEILEQFAKKEYEFVNGSVIEKQEKSEDDYVEVIIELNNFSEAESLISEFSEKEFIGSLGRNSSEKILAKISKEGFYKIIQNEAINRIYYNARMYPALDKSNSRNMVYFITDRATLLLILFIIYVRKYKSKEIFIR